MSSHVPPLDLDVEAAVLGGAMHPDGGDTILTMLASAVQGTDFYTEAHRKIYACMLALRSGGHPVDQITVTSALRSAHELDAIGGPPKIAQLVEAGLHAIPAHVPTYIDQLLEVSRKRSLRALGQRIVHAASNGASSAATIDDISATVGDLRVRTMRQRPDEAPSELAALLAHRFPPRADIFGRGLLTPSFRRCGAIRSPRAWLTRGPHWRTSFPTRISGNVSTPTSRRQG